MNLDICFSTRFRSWKEYDYFGDYIKAALLEARYPDYFILCKLADEVLSIRKDRPLLPTVESVDRMREHIAHLLRKKDFESLLKNFGNSMRTFVALVNARQLVLNSNREAEIALQSSSRNIQIENFIDCTEFPSDFEYITVSINPLKANDSPEGEV